MSLLTRTLFAPYRHDAVDMSKLPIRYWGQAITANLVSRTIGFILRLGVLFAGAAVELITAIGAIVFLVAWYLLPVLFVVSVAWGLVLLSRGLGL